MRQRIALLASVLLVACGGAPEDVVYVEVPATGGAAGAVTEATGGNDVVPETGGAQATGGSQETGGAATGGAGPITGGTATGGSQTGGIATGGVVAPVCEAGRQVACSCSGGESGVQACRSDGSGWLACDCPDPGTGGTTTGGAATGGSAPTGGAPTGGYATGGAAVICEPNRAEECTCVDEDWNILGEGTTTCSSDGTEWSECWCEAGTGGAGGSAPTTETACWDQADDDSDGSTDCDDSDCCTAEYCCEADGTCHSDHLIALGMMIDCICWELCDPDARPSGGSEDIGINPDTHHCVFVGSPAYRRAQASCSVTG